MGSNTHPQGHSLERSCRSSPSETEHYTTPETLYYGKAAELSYTRRRPTRVIIARLCLLLWDRWPERVESDFITQQVVSFRADDKKKQRMAAQNISVGTHHHSFCRQRQKVSASFLMQATSSLIQQSEVRAVSGTSTSFWFNKPGLKSPVPFTRCQLLIKWLNLSEPTSSSVIWALNA